MLKRKLNVEKYGICLPEFATVMSAIYGFLAQLVRALGLHPRGRRFESCSGHNKLNGRRLGSCHRLKSFEWK